MQDLARTLIVTGVIITFLGIFFYFKPQIDNLPFAPGKLPGDIKIEKKNYSFYFPIVTSLLLSAFLSLVFYIIGRLNR